MGRGRAADARTGRCIRPHRRIRMVPLRAPPRPVSLGLARQSDEHARRSRAENRARHADRGSAEMADGRTSRDRADRRTGATARLRLAPALHLLVTGLLEGERANRRGPVPALWRPSGPGRVADRQRIRLPRHRALVGRIGPRGVPRLAARRLSIRRPFERSLGIGVLVDGARQFRRAVAAELYRDRAQSGGAARLLAVPVAAGRGLQSHAVRYHPCEFARPLDHPQLHGLLQRFRSLAAGREPGFRGLGLVSARLCRGLFLRRSGA